MRPGRRTLLHVRLSVGLGGTRSALLLIAASRVDLVAGDLFVDLMPRSLAPNEYVSTRAHAWIVVKRPERDDRTFEGVEPPDEELRTAARTEKLLAVW
jgi:hypothetical protein